MSSLDWMDQAACLEIGDEGAFPDKGKPSAPYAKTACGGCVVRKECLRFAFDTGSTSGVFGGLSAKERRYMTPKERQEAVA